LPAAVALFPVKCCKNNSSPLCLRIAKNDLWHTRVDTSQDVPLMQVDVPNQTWSGGGYPPSWKKPYPPSPAAPPW